MLSAPLVSQFFFYGSEEAEMMKRRKHTAALQDEMTAASLYMWVWTTHGFIFDLILRWQEIDELASWLTCDMTGNERQHGCSLCFFLIFIHQYVLRENYSTHPQLRLKNASRSIPLSLNFQNNIVICFILGPEATSVSLQGLSLLVVWGESEL